MCCFHFYYEDFHLLVAINSNILITDHDRAFQKILKYFIHFQTFVYLFSQVIMILIKTVSLLLKIFWVSFTWNIPTPWQSTELFLNWAMKPFFLFVCLVLAFETASWVYQKILEFDMMLRLASNLRSSYPSLLSNGWIALLISGSWNTL